MTLETETETTPVAHEHESGPHTHADGSVHEHAVENPEPASPQGYVPDPAVQAFVTTITLAVAHTNEVGPYETVKNVTAALEGLGLRGVVTGVASVELRGDGGLIGL